VCAGSWCSQFKMSPDFFHGPNRRLSVVLSQEPQTKKLGVEDLQLGGLVLGMQPLKRMVAAILYSSR
jgi:hypothetical protein